MADKPIYHAFSVRKCKKEDGSDDAFWTKIGVRSQGRQGVRRGAELPTGGRTDQHSRAQGKVSTGTAARRLRDDAQPKRFGYSGQCGC
jgi:hypothetical protein